MKFEFDSNNATELRAVEAAVAVLLGKQAADGMDGLAITVDARKLPKVDQARFQMWGDLRTAQDDASATAIIEKALTAERENVAPSPLVAAVVEAQQKLEAGTQTLGAAFDKAVDQVGAETVVAALTAEDLDSAGQPWNPELHSSSRAKVADGTWKKKRSVKTEAPQPLVDAGEFPKIPDAPVPPTPVTPPAPPVPVPAAGEPSAEQKIWALITGQVVTINRVLEVARAHGHADLGALRQADEAAKAEVLRVLEGE